jgi:hypothetical protein
VETRAITAISYFHGMFSLVRGERPIHAACQQRPPKHTATVSILQCRKDDRCHVTVLPCSPGGRCELNLRSPCPTRPLKLVGIAVGGPAAICAALFVSL